MTLYPHAQWRPLADQQPGRMSGHDLIILHTAVGSLASTDAYFREGGYGGTESHFGVGHDGTVYQWTDLECRADANLDANSHAISIETADRGEGFPYWDPGGTDVPAWRPEQVEAIAQIVAWCAQRYSIPLVLVPDSKPGRRGVGYHRQGIDPWRVDSGERWSTHPGKVCPGERRISQVPAVIDRARAIAAGDSQPDQPSEEDDMPKPYLESYGGGVWVVAADLSSRTGLKASADVTALLKTGQYIVSSLSDATIAGVPVAGANKADLSDADLMQAAQLNADALAAVLGQEG